MNGYDDSEEEDNNPFSGTNHLYASGIAAVPDGQDDFVPPTSLTEIQEKEETRDELMQQLFGSEIRPSNQSELENSETIDEAWQVDTDDPESLGPPLSIQHESLSLGRVPTFHLPIENQKVKIIDAGHFRDAYGKYAIGYTIEFEDKQVVRRYSEFDTLRHALYRLLPTIIVPPIPSKHPLIRYFLNPLSAEKDIRIIDRRKRLLSLFLNNCYAVPEVRDHIVFNKFLDPEQIWKNVINSPPISIIPPNNLLAPPLQPTKPSPLHLLLPNANHNPNKLEPANIKDDTWNQESQFKEVETVLRKFEKVLNPLEKTSKQNRMHFQALASSLAELGAYYNAFSLEGNILTIRDHLQQIEDLSKGIEKTGQAIDVNYVSSEIVAEQVTILIEEPVAEMIQSISEARNVLQFRELKMGQYRIVESTIKRRELRIKNLEEAQQQMERLEEALRKNAQQSPTVALAVQNMRSRNTTPGSLTPSPSGSQTSSKTDGSSNRAGWTDLFKSRRSAGNGSRTRRSSSNARELEPHLLTDDERKEEVIKIKQELQKLNECFKLIKKDVYQVNESVHTSLMHLLYYLKERCSMILKSFAHVLLVWLKDSLVAWQNARVVIDSIEVSSQ
ncbi:LADA_0G13344g1_1 [Lachancea dasiensis]|uniref:LADA_0G13344g1_1 n=1 Tax=Lachancea dasiensis TaxID=1072105 RepID=A0A1G4JVL3_9SACH|nr:LADA_0G13344g1_1 [Lachancea dasiensis]